MNYVILSTLFLSLVLIAIRKFIFVSTIAGYSMYPTLKPNDRVVVLRHWPSKWLQQGNIVVSHRPNSNHSSILSQNSYQDTVIKRVIGLSGDTVILKLPKELNKAYWLPDHEEHLGIWPIPKEHFFLKGDAWGADSRIWGAIPTHLFIGIVIMKLPNKAPNV